MSYVFKKFRTFVAYFLPDYGEAKSNGNNMLAVYVCMFDRSAYNTEPILVNEVSMVLLKVFT